MTIDSLEDLERALIEYQDLASAPDGTTEAARRRELDAEIRAYYVQHPEEMRPAKPAGSVL